ncbi:unnamed protein product [Protopolystoma xenopodis]|uniref:Uncharacterized protein n=1 Tax=Protopolystoma xenopodis TaxID=117903 RepID=A0A3S5ADF2_9PLAT|nr:unnamed protein product [Protopolystoma xenopodis]
MALQAFHRCRSEAGKRDDNNYALLSVSNPDGTRYDARAYASSGNGSGINSGKISKQYLNAKNEEKYTLAQCSHKERTRQTQMCSQLCSTGLEPMGRLAEHSRKTQVVFPRRDDQCPSGPDDQGLQNDRFCGRILVGLAQSPTQPHSSSSHPVLLFCIFHTVGAFFLIFCLLLLGLVIGAGLLFAFNKSTRTYYSRFI